MSSSEVLHPVTKRTTVSDSPRGPHNSKLTSDLSRSITSFGRRKNCWLVGEGTTTS